MSFFNELKRRNVVRVAIAYSVSCWLFLQILDFALDIIGSPIWIMQTLVLFAVLGLPVVMAFSWVYEMTPDGLRREKDIDRSHSITHQTGRKLDFIIIGVLVLALAYFIYESRLADSKSTPVAAQVSEQPEQSGQAAPAAETSAGGTVTAPAENSVAVLPFVNMSRDEDNEYFSDGLTETLLHMLAQIPDLQVAARTSSFAFKGKNEAIATVAKALGVAHVLEGSVQKAEGQVRITAQLIRADDGFHMWSQNYTRPLKDIFVIQDEIASDVADALGASLLGGDVEMHGVATGNLDAYDNYLKGLQEQAIFSYESLENAGRHFKQALLEDPEFTDARLALVKNLIFARITGLINHQDLKAQVTPMLQGVLASEPENYIALAYELYVRIHEFPLGRTQEQLRDMSEQLLDLLAKNPTDSFLRAGLAGIYSNSLDENARALEILQAGLLIDPLDAVIYQQLAYVYLDMEDYDNAIAAAKRQIALAPDNPNSYNNLAEIERNSGDLVAALKNYRKAIELDPQDHEFPAVLARQFYLLGLPEEGEYWYQRTQTLSPASVVSRALSVQRAYARKDFQQVIALAEPIISEQMNNRQGALLFAVEIYSDVMMRLDRSREAYDFLVSVRPDIISFDSLPEDDQGVIMQRYSIFLMTGFASREELKSAYDGFSALMDAQGYDWLPEDSYLKTIDLIMNDDLQGAVNHQVNIRMERPVGADLYIHQQFLPQVYQEVHADPQVVAKMAERNRQVDALREEVRDMLQEREWQQ